MAAYWLPETIICSFIRIPYFLYPAALLYTFEDSKKVFENSFILSSKVDWTYLSDFVANGSTTKTPDVLDVPEEVDTNVVIADSRPP